VTPFFGGLPWHGGKGPLEEGVIDDVTLVIFALDDPVAWENLAFSSVCEDRCGASALLGFYQEGSAGPKGLQLSTPDGVVLPTRSISTPRI
jgi:hypothetical protein